MIYFASKPMYEYVCAFQVRGTGRYSCQLFARVAAPSSHALLAGAAAGGADVNASARSGICVCFWSQRRRRRH